MSNHDTSHIARQPAGSPDGGKFAAKPGGAEASTSLEPGPGEWDELLANPRTRRLAQFARATETLSDDQVKALRDGGKPLAHGSAEAAEGRAWEAIHDADTRLGTDSSRDVMTLLDFQDNFAKDHPNPSMYHSDAIIAANSALVALAARDTGKLSQDDFTALTAGWENAGGSLSGPPAPTEVEQQAINDAGLNSSLHSPTSVAHFEHIWMTGEGGFGARKLHDDWRSAAASKRDLATGKLRPRDIIGTGYKGDTRKLANDYLGNRLVEITRDIATRGRTCTVNAANVDYRRRQALSGQPND